MDLSEAYNYLKEAAYGIIRRFSLIFHKLHVDFSEAA
jgi:hypothetical protein